MNADGAAPPIRLYLMPQALDRDGEPRAALVVPPTPSRYERRTVTLLFSSVAAALAAKRGMECAEPRSRASTP